MNKVLAMKIVQIKADLAQLVFMAIVLFVFMRM